MHNRIRNLREDADLTQKQIAEYLNMSQTGYSKYETGENDIPSFVWQSLAEFYNTSVDYLMGRTNKKFGAEKKVITTYSEKDSEMNFVIHQSQAEIKVVENDLGKLSNLEVLMIKKLRKISNEDKNDVAQYLYNKEDI